jgi:hypothetical protein
VGSRGAPTRRRAHCTPSTWPGASDISKRTPRPHTHTIHHVVALCEQSRSRPETKARLATPTLDQQTHPRSHRVTRGGRTQCSLAAMGARLTTAQRLKNVGTHVVGVSAAAAGVAALAPHAWRDDVDMSGTQNNFVSTSVAWTLTPAAPAARTTTTKTTRRHTPTLQYAQTERNDRLVSETRALHEPHPPPPLWGHSSHLQMAVHNWKKKQGASAIALRRELLRHEDGGVTALDWVEGCGGSSHRPCDVGGILSNHTTSCEGRERCTDVSGVDSSEGSTVPVVVLLHTITGEVVEKWHARACTRTHRGARDTRSL